MKYNKTAGFSYNGYLHSIRYSEHDADRAQLEGMFNNYKSYSSPFKEIIPLFFIIDYTTQRYLFFSESSKQVTGYEAARILDDGLELTIQLMHPDFWKVYNQRVFPAVTRFLGSRPSHTHPEFTFSFNTQLKCANGKWINLLQNSRYISSPATGLPIYCLGMVTDITSFNLNNIMNFRVDGTEKKTGQTLVLEQHKFYIYEQDRLLTKTEKLVLNYLAEGLSSKMIAGKIKISENTIENHRQTMLRKTESQNVAQMVAFAVRKGII